MPLPPVGWMAFDVRRNEETPPASKGRDLHEDQLGLRQVQPARSIRRKNFTNRGSESERDRTAHAEKAKAPWAVWPQFLRVDDVAGRGDTTPLNGASMEPVDLLPWLILR